MEKRASLLLGGLLSMCLVYPLLLLLGACFNFEVIVRNWGMHGVVFTAAFILLSAHVLRCETVSSAGSVLAVFLLPASVLHAFFWTWGVGRFWLAALLSLLWVGFAAALMMKHAKSFGGKNVAYVLSLLLLLPTLAGVLLLPFTFGSNTVTQTVISPEGGYRAEVLDSDQGALGGDTIVRVYDTQKQWDTIVFLVRKKPQVVYWGDWGEFETMKLQWESEQILLINGRAYEVE